MIASRSPRWTIEPGLAFLNHGSFGACPTAVLERQSELRARMERQPVQFFVRDLLGLLDAARAELAAFLGVANPRELALVPNATAGVNAVLRSLELRSGRELLTTDHVYPACRNALDFVARRRGLQLVVARVPFPLSDPAEVTSRILEQASDRTALALIDHVTSPTGLVFPIEQIVTALRERGIPTLVDGAHAPGMLSLDLDRLGAAYYTGNCHKWICAPKGAGFLHVPLERQAAIRPPVTSHGAGWPPGERGRFLLEFDWTGTADPTPLLCVPEALRAVGAMLPGGWDEVRRTNRELALTGRRILCEALGQAPPCPESMIGSMAAVPLPDGSPEPPTSFLYLDPLQDALLARHRVEVPIVPWPAPPRRLVRVSAQLYNRRADYERLAAGLVELGVTELA